MKHSTSPFELGDVLAHKVQIIEPFDRLITDLIQQFHPVSSTRLRDVINQYLNPPHRDIYIQRSTPAHPGQQYGNLWITEDGIQELNPNNDVHATAFRFHEYGQDLLVEPLPTLEKSLGLFCRSKLVITVPFGYYTTVTAITFFSDFPNQSRCSWNISLLHNSREVYTTRHEDMSKCFSCFSHQGAKFDQIVIEVPDLENGARVHLVNLAINK